MICRKCGDPGQPFKLIGKGGAVVGTGALCESCMTTALDGARRLSVEFEALISAGVSREDANRIMIAKINGRHPVA